MIGKAQLPQDAVEVPGTLKRQPYQHSRNGRALGVRDNGMLRITSLLLAKWFVDHP